MVWLQLNNERLQGSGKNIKDLCYGPFEVLKKVGDNAKGLSLPPYMRIYSVGSGGGVGPTFHRELSTRCWGRVVRWHSFVKVVKNYKTGETWPLENWVETSTSKKNKVVLEGEGKGKIYSPHSIKILGKKILPKCGGMIHIQSVYYFSSISML